MTNTPQEIAEYERRVAAGLNPEPLVPRIELAALAGEEAVRRVGDIEQLNQLSTTRVRGKEFIFHTPSKRLLWQAFGQEYIEPELLDFIDAMPAGARYFDIGASNGIFALYAAATGKKVCCFEAEAANFTLLNYNTYLNRAQHEHRVLNFNIALSDHTGLGDMYIQAFEPGGHMKVLGEPMQREHGTFAPDFVQAVLKYRLDDFLALTQLPPPEYMKIDIDGAELQALHGMQTLLGNTALRHIFIELDETSELATRCTEWLLSYGFVITKRKRVQNYFGLENIIFSR